MEVEYDLDIFGQQPLLKIYTQICLCFTVFNHSSQATIVSTLRNGLDRLHANFPWVTGEVVNQASGEGTSGTFKIRSSERHIPWFSVNNLNNHASAPSMSSLREASFPISMLDESDIAPRTTIPSNSQESAPVFLIQATFITGGLILTFLTQHQTMDMTGQGHVISLLSRACRNEPFNNDEISSGNAARQDIIPLLDNFSAPGPELTPQIIKISPSQPPSTDTPDPALPPSCTWANISFSPSSSASLKSLATQYLPPSTTYITTDDALSAFLWQRITLARLPRLSHSTTTTLARAVDVRRYLNIPPTYPGLAQNMSYHTFPLHSLVSKPLGAIASEFRLAVDPQTSSLAYNTRLLATHLSKTPDKSTISFTATTNPSTDILLSSWAKVDCYNLDFGLGLGNPEAVRRPRFAPFESLIYLLPKSASGEICVAMCLRDEDWARLRADDEFVRYASYIG